MLNNFFNKEPLNHEQFIEDVLQHPWIVSLIFVASPLDEREEGKEYKEQIEEYKKGTNPIHVFMASHARWLLMNDEGQCYGLLDGYVILLDEEGDIRYFCHGFENIAEIMLSIPMSVESMTNYASWQGIKFDDVLKEYRLLLNKTFGIMGKLFNKYDITQQFI